MLRIDKIFKKYQKVSAVDDVTLDLREGELCTLLGPSGCGKTTLLRIIAGLEKQTSGKIFINDIDVTLRPPFERDIGMVFQSYALFPHLDVKDNILYGLRVIKRPRDEMAKSLDEICQVLDLSHLLDRRINQLSGGQQQRVALARALIMKPKILLFDEPLSNLDAKLRRGIREEIRSVQKRYNITSIYVTHDQNEALAISDRICIMNSGKIVQSGTPHDLYETPISDFVANFIGEANIITLDGKPCLIRPEKIKLHSNHAAGFHQGRVLKATYLGWCMEYTAKFDFGELFVIAADTSTQIYKEGDAVYLDMQGTCKLLLQKHL